VSPLVPEPPEPPAERKEKVARAFARAEETLKEMEALFQQGLYNGAIDRAYYAAFHAATAALIAHGLGFTRHSAVIAQFGKEFAKTKRPDPRHHQTLIEAFSLRQKADYDVIAPSRSSGSWLSRWCVTAGSWWRPCGLTSNRQGMVD